MYISRWNSRNKKKYMYIHIYGIKYIIYDNVICENEISIYYIYTYMYNLQNAIM